MSDLLALQDVMQRHHTSSADTVELDSVGVKTNEAESTNSGDTGTTPPELYDYDARARRKTIIVGTLIVALVLFSFVILFILSGKSDQ